MSCWLTIAGDWAQHSSSSLLELLYTSCVTGKRGLFFFHPPLFFLSFWLFCILTLSPVPAVLTTFLPEHLPVNVQVSLLPACPRELSAARHLPSAFLSPLWFTGICVLQQWGFTVKVHDWLEWHLIWNKQLPQITANATCRGAKNPMSRGVWTDLSPQRECVLGRDWGTTVREVFAPPRNALAYKYRALSCTIRSSWKPVVLEADPWLPPLCVFLPIRGFSRQLPAQGEWLDETQGLQKYMEQICLHYTRLSTPLGKSAPVLAQRSKHTSRS